MWISGLISCLKFISCISWCPCWPCAYAYIPLGIFACIICTCDCITILAQACWADLLFAPIALPITISSRRHLENTWLDIQIDLTVTLVYTQRTNWLLHHRPWPVYYHLINWPFACCETKGQQHVHCHTLHILSPDILPLVVHGLTIRDTTAPHSKSFLPTT